MVGLFDLLRLSQGAKLKDFQFVAIGQSHLDAAWKWRKQQTIEKAFITFSNAIRNMGRYDQFTFSQSSPQYYEWMRIHHPDLFKHIQEAVEKGRWEIVGGMWVEPDTNLVNGESLVRQRLYGQRYYQKYFGKIATIEWMPDCFGYTWNLPQILAKSGSPYFWTGKMDWNDTSLFPFLTFHWHSGDGTSVLTHFSPVMAFNLFKMKSVKKNNLLLKEGSSLISNYETYDRAMSREDFTAQNIKELSLFYGYGDGGHGPKDAEVNFIRALEEKKRIIPMTAATLFDQLKQYEDRLPVWQDEMYLEYHRGCYTTNGKIKQLNHLGEINCYQADFLSAAAHLLNHQPDLNIMEEIWKTVLFNQFHDILPGSSIPEVYDDAYVDMEEAITKAQEVIQTNIAAITADINTKFPISKSSKEQDYQPIIIFNPLFFHRSAPVYIEMDEAPGYHVVDAQEKDYPSQFIPIFGKKYLVFMDDSIPAAGYKTYYLKKISKPKESNLKLIAKELSDSSISLENDFLKVRIDGETGTIGGFVDKKSASQILKTPANIFRLYHDHPKKYDAWNIDPDYRNKELPLEKLTIKPKIKSNGSVYAMVEMQGIIHQSPYTLQIFLFRRLPYLLFHLNIHWQEQRKILKVDFPFLIPSDKCICGIPYGIIQRSCQPKNLAQKGMWEMPFQKWIVLQDQAKGFALFTGDKYGFSVQDKTVSLTLLRSPKYPSPVKIAKNLKPKNERPIYNDQGEHSIYYALYPFSGDYVENQIWNQSASFVHPIFSNKIDVQSGNLDNTNSFFQFDAKTTLVGSCKIAEDTPADSKVKEIVIRLAEMVGQSDHCRILLNPIFSIQKANETNLLEEEITELPIDSENTLKITLNPREIKTIKLVIKPINNH